jgi:hypothetical protein
MSSNINMVEKYNLGKEKDMKILDKELTLRNLEDIAFEFHNFWWEYALAIYYVKLNNRNGLRIFEKIYEDFFPLTSSKSLMKFTIPLVFMSNYMSKEDCFEEFSEAIMVAKKQCDANSVYDSSTYKYVDFHLQLTCLLLQDFEKLIRQESASSKRKEELQDCFKKKFKVRKARIIVNKAVDEICENESLIPTFQFFTMKQATLDCLPSEEILDESYKLEGNVPSPISSLISPPDLPAKTRKTILRHLWDAISS